MKTNLVAVAVALPDDHLLARIVDLAARERGSSAELVAHLAALEVRPAVYAARGYGSLFGYCTQALQLSEDAACNRIEAARACLRFPVLVDMLSSGALSLTTLRLVARHLTPENHAAILTRASGRTRAEVAALVAALAPRPDAPTVVRRLPPTASGPVSAVQATAPDRYKVQFTIDQHTHDTLRRVQGLLRRDIPSGDAGAIFARALVLLAARVEGTKTGTVPRPRAARALRSGTDGEGPASGQSRHVPRAVQRAVWARDQGQCAFVSADGRRCSERAFLELHHRQPYAKKGPPTVHNIALHCRRHNQYEAEREFGRAAVRRSRRPRTDHCQPEGP